MNHSSIQKQKRLELSFASAPAPINKDEYNGHYSQNFRARPAQSQGSVARRGATSCTGGGANSLYAIMSRPEQENSLVVVTGMVKVVAFNVYSLLVLGQSVYFLTLYVANKFDIIF